MEPWPALAPDFVIAAEPALEDGQAVMIAVMITAMIMGRAHGALLFCRAWGLLGPRPQ